MLFWPLGRLAALSVTHTLPQSNSLGGSGNTAQLVPFTACRAVGSVLNKIGGSEEGWRVGGPPSVPFVWRRKGPDMRFQDPEAI